MNMTIFSGGTGSSQLVRGLREICQTNKITHIINLYDDGKSTGVCRNVCDTLGPSDMRKVHYLHYTCKQYADARNSFIEKLYKERYVGKSKKQGRASGTFESSEECRHSIDRNGNTPCFA